MALHVACAERNLDCATAILDYPEGSLIINSQNEVHIGLILPSLHDKEY